MEQERRVRGLDGASQHLLAAPDFSPRTESDSQRLAHFEALRRLLPEIVVQLPGSVGSQGMGEEGASEKSREGFSNMVLGDQNR